MQPYFCYGSNMDAAEMQQRCPGAALQGIAVLPDHRLMITADGFATIVPDQGKRVMGALWQLTESDERALDDYEDIASGFYRRDFIVVEAQGGVAVLLPAARVGLTFVFRSPDFDGANRWDEFGAITFSFAF
jgi:hypothetical protein